MKNSYGLLAGLISGASRLTLVSLPLGVLVVASGLAGNGTGSQTLSDLKSLSIEQLMEIEVTTATKRSQKLSETAAAVFVISKQDIRRSSARRIPELLRQVPGLQVARIDSNKWAITSRGFNGRLANKLLVLIDGRSVYTPLFSGVYWEVQDVMLDDIERIEVIRGPGAALWGANAVNGVINIITKHAADTQGGILVAGAGDEEKGFGGIRYGTRLGKEAFLRGYAKHFERGNGLLENGDPATDDWRMARGGFRLDWRASASDELTLHGDIYQGDAGQQSGESTPQGRAPSISSRLSGSNVVFEWRRSREPQSETKLRLYFDHTFRGDISDEKRDTFDAEFQQSSQIRRHELTWGLTYRTTKDSLNDDSPSLRYSPPRRRDHFLGAYVHNETGLLGKRLRLTLGSKFEFIRFGGGSQKPGLNFFEVQPNVRLLWTPSDRQSIWAAVSKAARLPSRSERDLNVLRFLPPEMPQNPFALQVAIGFFGSNDFRSEKLVAYEAGYRARLSRSFKIDVAGFFNRYDRLRSIESSPPFLDPPEAPKRLILPFLNANRLDGESYGVEIAANWQPLSRLRLSGQYSYLRLDLDREAGSTDTLESAGEGRNPRHQFFVKASFDPHRRLLVDLDFRFVGSLPAIQIDRYATVDARLAWRPRDWLELSVNGRNLGSASHLEFRPVIAPTPTSQLERNLYGQVRFAFSGKD